MSEAGLFVLYVAVCASIGAILWAGVAQFGRGLKEARDEFTRRRARNDSPGANRNQNEASSEDEAPPHQKTPNEEARSEHRPRTWFEVLEVSESASMLEIKDAYRKQVALYHPDRVASMGIGLRSVAEARTKEINAAYTMASRFNRGAG